MASANNLSESMNDFRFLRQTNMLEVIKRKPVDKENHARKKGELSRRVCHLPFAALRRLFEIVGVH